MRLIQHLFFALALTAAAAASASADKPVNGREYLQLPETQNTDAGAKIEVTEFFSYSCPHCHAFEPALAAWVAKNQGKIVFKRVHVAFNGADVPLQRLYSTLEALGVTEQNHAKVFEAIHVKRARLNSDEAVFEWAQSAGLDAAKFSEAYRSFGTQARVNRAKAMATSYKINQWPMLAIDGRFLTSPYQAGSTASPALGEAESQQAALKVVDALVAKSLAEKK
jgi:thiol:disulfide interchange protein DsbA